VRTRLRPMGARDILDNTFSILRERFWTFQGVIFFSFLPSLILFIIGAIYVAIVLFSFPPELFSRFFFTSNEGWSMLFNRFGVFGLVFLGLLLFCWFISLLVGGMYITHGNIRVFQFGLHQEKCTVKEALRGMKRKWLWYFLYGILSLIISMIISAPGIMISVALSFSDSPLLQNIISLIINALQFAAGFFICLTPVVIAVEETDAVKALIRGYTLLKHYRWKVLGVLFLVYLLGYVLFSIMIGITVVSIVLAVKFPSLLMISLATLLVLGGCFIFNIMISYYFGPLTAIYYDLIIRKEGYDLQLEAGETATESPNPAPAGLDLPL
jgi:hypothetical protein